MHPSSSLYTEFSKIIINYEKSKTSEAAEKDGIFYTPIALARKMAADCLAPYLESCSIEELFTIKILDPSCGSGIFLLVCYELLLQKLLELKEDNLKNREKLLKNCIFGIDKDEAALSIAIRLLSEACGQNKLELKHNLIAGNSLFSAEDFNPELDEDDRLLNETKIFSWKNLLPHAFTLVIGNPPYGISRNEKLSALENSKLKKVYSKYKLGKVNKYLAFMAKGFEILQPGGTMSYVVPNAWLGIQAGKGIRELFNKYGSFESIELFEKPVFSGIDVETIVFRFKKSKDLPEISLINYNNAEDFSILSKNSFDKKLCTASTEFIIPVKWNENLSYLRQHLSETCCALVSDQSPFEPLIALQAYSKGKGIPPQSSTTVSSHAFHSLTKESDDFIPYLEGRDISRYTTNWSGKYLRYGKHLAEPQVLTRFQGSRILLREILNPQPYVLIAALVKEPYLYNKSVLHIISKTSTSDSDFYALLGILNSSFAGTIISNFGRKSQRKIFPKIVNADLKNFPLPSNFSGLKELGKLAVDISHKAGHKKDISRLQIELDLQVYNAYQVKNIV